MKRRTALFALGGVAVLGGLLPATSAAWAADDVLSIDNNQKFLDDYKRTKGVITRPSGLMFRIIQNGFGKRPQSTDTVKVYYTGKLINGVIFDGTSPGLPASFKLNSVIPGWIEALQLMREGDHWQLVIPANLGYGVRGQGDGLIPPNQTLIFDLKLLGTTPAPRRGDKDYRPEPGDEDQQ
jgi:FKBP-type peptidyl-prolyl cis-trans isomerase